MTDYEERLVAPPRIWVAGTALSLLGAAFLHGGAGGARAVVPYVVVPVVVLGTLLLRSRGRVRVRDGLLSVPGARIPLDRIGAVTPLSRETTRRLRGPLAEPLAYVATREWLSRAVQVQIVDPEDDVPYWLVGTRHPAALAAALTSAAGTHVSATAALGRAPGDDPERRQEHDVRDRQVHLEDPRRELRNPRGEGQSFGGREGLGEDQGR